MKKKVFLFTTNRADYGLLKSLIFEFSKDTSFEFKLIITNSHLDSRFGSTVNEIKFDKIKSFKEIKINQKNSTPKYIIYSISEGFEKISKYLIKNKPDLIVVLGDRFELIPICYSSVILNIPIAHFAGGESSEGSTDEVTRHCITKMSHIHFVSHKKYKQKVINMGENPSRVFNIGSLSVDNIKNSLVYNKREVLNRLLLNQNSKFFLVTYHPSTIEINKSIKELKNLLHVLKKFKNYKIIITGTNNDQFSNVIKKHIINSVRNNKNFFYKKSLGSKLYISAMKYSECVIGNSSSGILEAPYLKKPVVNIGDRQKGRFQSNNIINCSENKMQINNSIKKALSQKFKRKIIDSKYPFGNGGTAKKVIKIIKKINLKKIIKKKFYSVK